MRMVSTVYISVNISDAEERLLSEMESGGARHATKGGIAIFKSFVSILNSLHNYTVLCIHLANV